MSEHDAITVLRSRGPLLAKRITPAGIADYDNARTFDVFPVRVSGINDIGRLVLRLLHAPRGCVIRADLIDPNNRHGVRRLLHDDGGDRAVFQDVPRRWVALDVDGVPRPPAVAVTDLPSCAALALDRLPAPFHTARIIAQATAGHGIKDGIRLRLWAWLARPVVGDELAKWIGDAVDPVSFRPVQIIYTAAPIFDDRPDPLPRRLAKLPGDDVVQVPPRPPPEPPRPSQLQPLKRHGKRYVDAALADAVRNIAHASVGSRHHTLLHEGARLLRFVPDRLSANDLAQVLYGAARAVGLEERESGDMIRWLLAKAGAA